MHRQTHITVFTTRHPSALFTFQHRCPSTTVLKQNGLFSTLQRLTHILQQNWRERSRHHLTMLQVTGIHHLNLRQFNTLIALFQFHQSILSRFGIVVRLQCRRSRTKQGLSPQHDSRTTRMITRHGVLLLIRCLVLLVNNHESQALEGQKHRTSRTEYHIIRILRELLLPYLHTLSITVFRVIDAQPLTEHTLQALHHLHRQRNLRH